jgi:hypothetical protein
VPWAVRGAASANGAAAGRIAWLVPLSYFSSASVWIRPRLLIVRPCFFAQARTFADEVPLFSRAGRTLPLDEVLRATSAKGRRAVRSPLA